MKRFPHSCRVGIRPPRLRAERAAPLSSILRIYACRPCQVVWARSAAECWACGRPPTSDHASMTHAVTHLMHGSDARNPVLSAVRG